jgi:CheY-like chemotaxis protein
MSESRSGAMKIVLIVDDEKALRTAMSRALQGSFRVLSAASAEEALACMRRESVDIVLADHMMPGGTGEELLRAVAADWPAVRRAMVSGTPPDHLDDLLATGLVEVFVPKPWTVDELLDAVGSLVGAREP